VILSEKSPSKSAQSSPGPALGEAGQARATEREARRAAALRANLTRRKAQSRARDGGGATGTSGDDVPDPKT